jgi:hypothetical protein
MVRTPMPIIAQSCCMDNLVGPKVKLVTYINIQLCPFDGAGTNRQS